MMEAEEMKRKRRIKWRQVKLWKYHLVLWFWPVQISKLSCPVPKNTVVHRQSRSDFCHSRYCPDDAFCFSWLCFVQLEKHFGPFAFLHRLW